MTELSFANDAAVVASTREDLVKDTVELNSVVTACGLTISIPKTKFWFWGVTWCRVTWTPLLLVVILLCLRYLGSLVESHSGVQLELNATVSCASLEGLF